MTRRSGGLAAPQQLRGDGSAKRVYFQGQPPGAPLQPYIYKGYSISPRTFQLRGSDRWTLDLLIGRNGQLRAFGGATTYATEAGANTACTEFGCRIIDGSVEECTVADLC